MFLSRVERNRLAHARNGNTRRTIGAGRGGRGRGRVAGAPASGALAASPASTAQQQLMSAPPALAVRDDLCLARVWACGSGAQCSRRRVEGATFCSQHRSRQPHGRVDNQVSLPAEARRFEVHAARLRRDA
jgi:hypothetical protein